MKPKRHHGWMVAVAMLMAAASREASAIGSAFSYQGQLRQGGNPLTGTCDFRFALFDLATAGTQVGTTQAADAVNVRSGVFTVQLDFGAAALSGADRWLEIAVRCPAGGGNVTTLSPRQPLTPAPYAITAPVAARDAAGNLRADAGLTSDGAGFVRTSGTNGTRNVLLSTFNGFPNGGYVGVFNDQGDERVSMAVGSGNGAGFVVTTGPNGNRNVLLGTNDDSADHGYVGVADENGNFKAGFFVNAEGKGETFADVKNFVVDYPEHPGAKIVYASLEGPEAAIYHRGVVKLRNGRATITLPEHFVALANLDTLTVQLTPRSFDSEGLGFDAVHDGRIEIGELRKGHGSYDVHFVVQALRRGYEGRQPVIAADEFRARFAPVTVQARRATE